MTQPFRGHDVLFLCRDNAVLSPMAEALLNHWGRGRFRAASAGWNPAIGVHAAAVRVLRRAELSPARLKPRSWTDVEPSGAPAFRFVVLVGRELPDRVAPVFAGDPILARWQVDGPSTGSQHAGGAGPRLRARAARDRGEGEAVREPPGRVARPPHGRATPDGDRHGDGRRALTDRLPRRRVTRQSRRRHPCVTRAGQSALTSGDPRRGGERAVNATVTPPSRAPD